MYSYLQQFAIKIQLYKSFRKILPNKVENIFSKIIRLKPTQFVLPEVRFFPSNIPRFKINKSGFDFTIFFDKKQTDYEQYV